jgi:hypothetical protein
MGMARYGRPFTDRRRGWVRLGDFGVYGGEIGRYGWDYTRMPGEPQRGRGRERPEQYGYGREYGTRGWPYGVGYEHPSRRRRAARGRPFGGEGWRREAGPGPYGEVFRGYERGGVFGGYTDYGRRYRGGPSTRTAPRGAYRPGTDDYGRDYLSGRIYDRDYVLRRYGREFRSTRGGRPLSDDEIRDEVCENLFNDSWLDARRINVDVDEGIATLTGEVRDFMEARYAWDDAWEAEGVKGVINNLTVRTDLPSDQPALPQSWGPEAFEEPTPRGR